MRTIKLYTILYVVLMVILLGLYLLLGYVVKLNFEHQYACANNASTRVLLVWGNGVGEQEQTHRFKIVAQRLGLELRVVSTKPENMLRAYFVRNAAAEAASIMRPDLILTIERDIPAVKAAPNYLVLDQSKAAYLYTRNDKLNVMSPGLYKFAGLLTSFPEIADLQIAYANNGMRYNGFTWYPTVYTTNYTPQAPKKLFYPGGILLDITRSSKKYTDLFKILDKSGYLAVYGPKNKWRHTPNSLHPPIPFDGISLLDTQNLAGISLVLHDAEHLHGNVPSGRIFEAAAANTIIISDQQQFIIDNFGDNVLYVDVTKNSEDIAAQIQRHVTWVFEHPAQAKLLAQNCHTIFMQKFTLEQQVQKLLELHNALHNT